MVSLWRLDSDGVEKVRLTDGSCAEYCQHSTPSGSSVLQTECFKNCVAMLREMEGSSNAIESGSRRAISLLDPEGLAIAERSSEAVAGEFHRVTPASYFAEPPLGGNDEFVLRAVGGVMLASAGVLFLLASVQKSDPRSTFLVRSVVGASWILPVLYAAVGDYGASFVSMGVVSVLSALVCCGRIRRGTQLHPPKSDKNGGNKVRKILKEAQNSAQMPVLSRGGVYVTSIGSSFSSTSSTSSSTSTTQAASSFSLRNCHDAEVTLKLQERGLSAEGVDKCLKRIREKIFEKSSNPEQEYIQTFLELVSRQCAVCHDGESFEGTGFRSTLEKCKKCSAMICKEGASCRSAHWSAHP